MPVTTLNTLPSSFAPSTSVIPCGSPATAPAVELCAAPRPRRIRCLDPRSSPRRPCPRRRGQLAGRSRAASATAAGSRPSRSAALFAWSATADTADFAASSCSEAASPNVSFTASLVSPIISSSSSVAGNAVATGADRDADRRREQRLVLHEGISSPRGRAVFALAPSCDRSPRRSGRPRLRPRPGRGA